MDRFANAASPDEQGDDSRIRFARHFDILGRSDWKLFCSSHGETDTNMLPPLFLDENAADDETENDPCVESEHVSPQDPTTQASHPNESPARGPDAQLPNADVGTGQDTSLASNVVPAQIQDNIGQDPACIAAESNPEVELPPMAPALLAFLNRGKRSSLPPEVQNTSSNPNQSDSMDTRAQDTLCQPTPVSSQHGNSFMEVDIAMRPTECARPINDTSMACASTNPAFTFESFPNLTDTNNLIAAAGECTISDEGVAMAAFVFFRIHQRNVNIH